MNLKRQIRSYRNELSISQEELADKMYVSRQTISNWETGKSYPDVHSLILLSTIFDTSIDELVKGDIEIMKEIISESDVMEYKKLSYWYFVSLCIAIMSVAPLFLYLKWLGFIISLFLFGLAFIPALKLEKFFKQNDVRSFKEITAFMEGKRIDEIEKEREKQKRLPQKIILAIGTGVVTFLVVYSMSKLIIG